MRRIALLTVLALGLALSRPGKAEDVWKWIDSQGHAQYSDQWVPGAQLIKSDRAHPASTSNSSDETSRLKESNAQISAELEREAAARAVQKDVATQRSEQCKQAKERYEKSIQARRIYRVGKDGEREYLTDEQADQERLSARMEMQQTCGSSASSASN